MDEWIVRFGYLAVLVGAALEGETLLLLAGFAAHRGYLSLPGVIAAAAAGAICTNQALFRLGRAHGPDLLDRWPAVQVRAQRFAAFAARYHHWVLLTYRFAYGTRAFAPFAIGMSGIPLARFTSIDTCVTLVWASAVGCAGFWLGDAVQRVAGRVERYEILAFAAVALAGTGIWLVRYVRARSR